MAAKAIDTHCQYWRTKETELEFIPHPSTWLNAERWEDELQKVRNPWDGAK
jgi:hypothetical protein